MPSPERKTEPIGKRYAQQRDQALVELRIIPGRIRGIIEEIAVLNPHPAPASEVDSQESLAARVNEVNRTAHQATWNRHGK